MNFDQKFQIFHVETVILTSSESSSELDLEIELLLSCSPWPSQEPFDSESEDMVEFSVFDVNELILNFLDDVVEPSEITRDGNEIQTPKMQTKRNDEFSNLSNEQRSSKTKNSKFQTNFCIFWANLNETSLKCPYILS